MYRFASVRALRGATLIELMTALTVGAILLAIAVPSFRHLMGSTKLSGVSNDLAGDLAYARTEAASRRVDVAVTSSSAGWAAGWTVNVPPSSSTSGTPPVVLRTHSPIPTTYTVATKPTGSTEVKYQPDGALSSAASVCFKLNAPGDTDNNATYMQVQASGSVQQASASAAPSGWTCP